MKSTALITGASGFTAAYVADALRQRGYEVVGLSREPSRGILRCDLVDGRQVVETVAEVRPRVIVHLAGVSNVVHGDVAEIYLSNIAAARNVLDAAVRVGGVETVLLPSTGHVYGNATSGELGEDAGFAPQSDYAVSKVAMELMARLWRDRVRVVLTRPFNYTGVGQSANFVVAKIVDHFRRRAPTIELGNIDVWRDISDVRDVADVYARLGDAGAIHGVFNVCSGVGYSIRDILETCARISGHRPEVRSNNQDLVRSADVSRLVGCNRRLREALPGIHFRPLDETLAWMLGDHASAPVFAP